MNIFIAPTWPEAERGDGGIRRVYEALVRYLPDFGMQVVGSIEDADLINCHAMTRANRPGVPMVASCHGLYWAEDPWPKSGQRVNRDVRETLIQSDACTVPSRWVRNAVTRGLAVNPEVIYHGCDLPDRVQPSEGYILWNKTRLDAVCDPALVGQLAARLPHRPFVSTFLDNPPPNVHVTGKMPHREMLDHVARAGVYLATVQETFGIGVIEALAAGVPVVGWDFGGQREIIRHGETGYLVPEGGVAALADAIERALAERDRLSANAREDARTRWQWPDKVAQYAALFRRTYDAYHAPRPRVSLIVPFHNLGKFLPDTVASVQAQDMPDWEMVIVDDASDPDEAKIALGMAMADERIQYNRATENLRPSRARNWGVQLSKGKYLLPLDADDMLAPGALRTLADALDADRSIAIAYGHLEVMREDGTERRRNPWPPAAFDWHAQMRRENQIPISAMMRREVWERTGGERERERSVEDAGLWCRATSVGFRARKVTEATTLWYRLRGNSWSRQGGQEQDYTAWLAWRHGQAVAPWGAQGDPSDGFWPVPSQSRPLVSVIIPVGPGHERYLPNALDSVFYSQRFTRWECVVVNDTGIPWDGAGERWSPVGGAPWATVVDTHGPKGVAAARNAGLAASSAPLVLFLDADDYLLPHFLEDAVLRQARTGGLVYTDVLIAKAEGPLESLAFDDFTLDGVLARMPHTNTVLIPRAALEEIGGLDETLSGWEDWDMFIALRAAGWCSDRLARPGFVYRHTTGARREESLARKPAVLAQLERKWGHLQGGALMACGCSKGSPVTYNGAMVAAVNGAAKDRQLFTAVEYLAEEQGTRTWRGPVTGESYRFANDPGRRIQDVDNRDLTLFRNRTEFLVREA